MTGQDLLLIACGILRDEVRALLARHGWPVETLFLEPSLHVDLGRLARCLTCALDEHRDREKIVLYGNCHPRMDDLLGAAGAVRTPGQNCVEMLLGREQFALQLEAGAFFLLEGWARGWEGAITETFGAHPEVVREIFRTSHRYLLGIRTPCSGDFAEEAAAASRQVGLPLQWVDVPLDHLEETLATTVRHATAGSVPSRRAC